MESIRRIDDYISRIVTSIFESRLLRIECSKKILSKYLELLGSYPMEYLIKNVHGLKVGFKVGSVEPAFSVPPTIKVRYNESVGGKSTFMTEEGPISLPQVPVFIYEPVDFGVIEKIIGGSQESLIVVRFPTNVTVEPVDYENTFGKYIKLNFSHSGDHSVTITQFDGKDVILMGALVRLKTFTSSFRTIFLRIVKVNGEEKAFACFSYQGKFTCESFDEVSGKYTHEIECLLLWFTSNYDGDFTWIFGSRPLKGNPKWMMITSWGNQYYMLEL